MELATDRMIAEVDGHIGWMIYNNPARHNAMSMDMQEAVPTILDRFEADPSVRVVVLRGAGEKSFISGADISEFEAKRSSVEARRLYDEASAAAGRALAHFSKPLIAMIHGYCIGGGLMTALRCDIRIADDRSRFAIPAARMGLGYGYPGVSGLVDVVGPAYANEILFSARKFESHEALRIGLVNRVVAPAELAATVRELAGQIGENAPLTIKAAKKSVHEILKDPEHRDMETVEQLIEDCFLSEDYIEGRRAFMEKRTPEFRGK